MRTVIMADRNRTIDVVIMVFCDFGKLTSVGKRWRYFGPRSGAAAHGQRSASNFQLSLDCISSGLIGTVALRSLSSLLYIQARNECPTSAWNIRRWDTKGNFIDRKTVLRASSGDPVWDRQGNQGPKDIRRPDG